MATQPLHYAVYAGWYGYRETPLEAWHPGMPTLDVFQYHGQHYDQAIAHLAALQQQAYDFVGLKAQPSKNEARHVAQ